LLAGASVCERHWPLALGSPSSIRRHRPHVVAGKQLLELAGALGLDKLLVLLADLSLVGGPFHRTQDPEDLREGRAYHPAQQKSEVGFLSGLVVHEQVGSRAVLAYLHDFQLKVLRVEADAAVAILAEDHGLAVLEVEAMVRLDALVGHVLENRV